ncbi:uncharacterized protein RCC_02536 [Ramularia collo-cygni]|uniref:F-box domain-containing protein n=1 Tax=Ramularia collo-cygni TaxID=112498 RepID=A0A2D3UNT4_9PEZI|nr:uncharacterized protein RCC_02536 [Ramularia collo-cygni]CZT16701.1 uncharacterized protein RCC_02536 [Ramularia collo-cygni]
MANNLPTELVERILSFAATTNTRTALAVCLTNRLGRRAGHPILYHTLELPGDDGDNNAGLLPIRMRSFALLCRTILGSPSLAIHVRDISAYVHDIDGLELPEAPISLSILDRLFRNVTSMGPAGIECTGNWLSSQYQIAFAAERDRDAQASVQMSDTIEPTFAPEVYLALLTLACRRIRKIHVSGPTTLLLRPFMQLGTLLQMKLPGRHRNSDGFSSVREIHFRKPAGKMETNWKLQYVGQALRWPSVEDIRIDALHGGMLRINALYGGTTTPFFGPEFQSTLTTLHIMDAMTPMEDLSILLPACSRLKSFTMSWSNAYDAYRQRQWRYLATLLQEHCPLLEKLDLDLPRAENLQIISVGAFPGPGVFRQTGGTKVNNLGIGSLHRLRHLRKLRVPSIVLFGVFEDVEERDHDWTLPELLPSSLEELDVLCEGKEFTDHDLSLLDSVGMDSLRSVTIRNCFRNQWISRDRSGRLTFQPGMKLRNAFR